MVQTDDDDLVLHRLFEPAPMPGGRDGISPQKIAEHDTETAHRKERRFFAAQAGRDGDEASSNEQERRQERNVDLHSIATFLCF